MDKLWAFISKIKAPDGSYRFEQLSRIARLILCIPHSNAEEERIFSEIKKNKTCFRPNLDPSETLGSIITAKNALRDKDISRLEMDPELLRLGKSATRRYDSEHKTK